MIKLLEIHYHPHFKSKIYENISKKSPHQGLSTYTKRFLHFLYKKILINFYFFESSMTKIAQYSITLEPEF